MYVHIYESHTHCKFITRHSINCVSVFDVAILPPLHLHSLNVIPMDLFCLSSVSCRVIDYGQFSKYPAANTSSIAISSFGHNVFANVSAGWNGHECE